MLKDSIFTETKDTFLSLKFIDPTNLESDETWKFIKRLAIDDKFSSANIEQLRNLIVANYKCVSQVCVCGCNKDNVGLVSRIYIIDTRLSVQSLDYFGITPTVIRSSFTIIFGSDNLQIICCLAKKPSSKK